VQEGTEERGRTRIRARSRPHGDTTRERTGDGGDQKGKGVAAGRRAGSCKASVVAVWEKGRSSAGKVARARGLPPAAAHSIQFNGHVWMV
jgi:hypothetical protein